MNHPAVNILIFPTIAFASSYLFYRLRVPAGNIVGPILVFIILQFFGYQASIPKLLKTIVSSLFGVYFALKISGLIGSGKQKLLLPLLATVI